MLPKKVKKRASLLAITLLVTVVGIFFILQSLNKNILYFKSPTDIKNIPITDISNVMAKSDALFFTFFGSINCFK